MQESPSDIIEERLGVIIVEGQRWEIRVRSQPDEEGTWHNALRFRRDGRTAGHDVLVAGVEWHVPPGIALTRAREMEQQEQIALFSRALAPRPPLF